MPAPRPQARGGLTAIHYWFIIFVGLWLVSTVLLVILYTDQSKLKRENDTWRAERDRLVRGNELDTLRAWYDKSGPQRSFVGVINDERADAVRLIGGSGSGDLSAAQKLVGDVVARIGREAKVTDASLYAADADLVSLLTRLYDDFTKNADLLASLKAENDQLKREDLKRMQASAEEKRQFQDAAADLQGRVQALHQEYDQSVQQRQEQIAQLTQSLSQSREAASADQKRLLSENEKLDEQVLKLANIIISMREQQKMLYEQDPAVLVKKMDGEVIDVISAAGIAYINIGRKDRVIAGLTFEVYPPSGRINPDGSGKGTLEVIGLGPDTAECRVVRFALGDPITVGDLIGNLVYDRQKIYRFAVIGGFDINADGSTDDGGAQVIQAIIEDWGGRTVDLVDETTDFLVLGAEPYRPALAEDAPPEVKAGAEEQLRVHASYLHMREQARVLAVPILTQTQFYNFMGLSGSGRRGRLLAGG